MATKRSVIIFDGSNFYFKLKSLQLPNLSDFNYLDFSKMIAKNTQIREMFYAIGKVEAKDNKSRKMMANQQSLVTRIQKNGFTIQWGYLLKSGGRYHEKGVDIQLAVNLMKGAYLNQYDVAYLVSSDTDLLPAIWEAQSVSKTVCYVGFRHQISYALRNQCKKHILLEKDDLLPFCK